jgi:hypothetical protein
MDGMHANHTLSDDELEVLELLQEMDTRAEQTQRYGRKKRRSSRLKVRFPCQIRYLAPDGRAVLTTSGRARDISHGGLGFVAREQFRRWSPLLITLSLADQATKRLTGTVAYSQPVREGWYLTGVKLGPIDNASLTWDANPQAAPNPTRAADVLEQQAGDEALPT